MTEEVRRSTEVDAEESSGSKISNARVSWAGSSLEEVIAEPAINEEVTVELLHISGDTNGAFVTRLTMS